MSRIAKNPVAVPSGVQVALAGAKLSVKGPKGNLEHEMHPLVKVMQEGNLLKFQRTNDSTLARAVSGTTRALVNNMVNGVAKGFEKRLTIIGVGYRVAVQGADKQLVGQVAAEIRAYRSPEPYKGKGVRYFNEVVVKKEAKKK